MSLTLKLQALLYRQLENNAKIKKKKNYFLFVKKKPVKMLENVVLPNQLHLRQMFDHIHRNV